MSEQVYICTLNLLAPVTALLHWVFNAGTWEMEHLDVKIPVLLTPNFKETWQFNINWNCNCSVLWFPISVLHTLCCSVLLKVFRIKLHSRCSPVAFTCTKHASHRCTGPLILHGLNAQVNVMHRGLMAPSAQSYAQHEFFEIYIQNTTSRCYWNLHRPPQILPEVLRPLCQ